MSSKLKSCSLLSFSIAILSNFLDSTKMRENADYEYMSNKPGHLHFWSVTARPNKAKSKLLDCSKRFHILEGVVRGLLYLHQDSRLRIIHRDLKSSNILLDDVLNATISDFGLARMFGADQTQASTKGVVGTYGYMALEYVIDGVFSMKSAVFSFSFFATANVKGRRNWGFQHPDHEFNFLGHAWILWTNGTLLELLDECLVDGCPAMCSKPTRGLTNNVTSSSDAGESQLVA